MTSPEPPRRPATARPRSDPDLEHGAPPLTPVELAAIERERIEWARLLGATVENVPDLRLVFASHASRGSGLNFAACVRWPREEVTARLGTVEARMRGAGLWPQVIVCDGLTEPADLAETLTSEGWLRVGSERMMWTRHPEVVPHLDPGLRIEAVTPASAPECARLELANFGLDPDAVGDSAALLARAVEAGETRAFIVRLAGEPIASARLVPSLTGSGVASLHAIGVAARHRRRGYGRLIIAVATRAGLATGHRLVWLSVDESNAAAIGLYRDLGFDFAFSWSRWLAPSRATA